ncbi:MAG TPA: M15 family metallopeptidase [Actinomycetota bacterium]|nr:M15 family metallopeptidase [Actinomycetota bacterium]
MRSGPDPNRYPRRRPWATPAAAALAASLALVGFVVAVRLPAGLGPGSPRTLQPPAAGPTTRSSTDVPPAASPTAEPDEPPTPPLPDCRYGDRRAGRTGYGQWRTILVDTIFRLPPDYEPPDLVPVSEAGFDAPFLVRRVVVRDLAALREAAQANGVRLELVSAYRSFEQQRDLFERRVQQLGRVKALRRTARPGHSEHQLGTALDFKTAGNRTVGVGWGETPAGRWMAENAHRFGFVLSYPEGERETTCYAFEPWHFRYVGPRMAAEVVASGRTLREFLWLRQWERSG